MDTEATKAPKNFKDLNIKRLPSTEKKYLGDKIAVEKILDKPIKILHYKVEPSQFPESGNGKCLWMQIEYRDELRIIRTNSVPLQLDMLEAKWPDDFPIITTIKQADKYSPYEFT